MFAQSFIFLLGMNIVYSDNSDNKKNTTMDGFIVFGFDASITSYPYATFLQLHAVHPSTCGASLLFVQIVLTAATCFSELVNKKGRVSALLGHEVPFNAPVRREVIATFFHPHYNEIRMKNNLALGYLNLPIDVFSSRTIRKIPLPPFKNVPDPEVTFSVGWGRQKLQNSLHDLPVHRRLMGTKQKLENPRKCGELANINSHDILMCSLPIAGHFYKDDVGSGLVAKVPNLYLMGVLSYIVDEVAVYTSTTINREWILMSAVKLFEKTCGITLEDKLKQTTAKPKLRWRREVRGDDLNCTLEGPFEYTSLY